MTGDGDAGCQLTLDEAKKVAGDLNEFVVAFDRIFSRIAFGEADSELLLSYMSERNFRQRLAEARSVVFDALERTIGEEAADRIAEEGYRHFD